MPQVENDYNNYYKQFRPHESRQLDLHHTPASHTHTHTHARTHAHTHTNKTKQKHACMRAHVHAHAHSLTHTHTCRHACTHAIIHMHAHTHTHTHTHTHKTRQDSILCQILTGLHWSMQYLDVDHNNRLCKTLQRHGDAPLTYDVVCETPLIRSNDFSEQLTNLSMMA